MKKRNFLGGMQNYNSETGEYESALVGPNGQVVKDADGDGKTNEGKKQTYDKMRKVLAKEGYPVDSYSDEEVDKAFTSLEKSIDAEDDKWRNKQKDKLTFEKVIKSADDDTLDEQFGKDTPERKLVGAMKEQDFNDPKERESLKEEEKEFNDEVSDEDIEVELADHEWAVTDRTTVGQYAEMVGGILGVPKERVLEKIKARSSNELDESSLMYKVIDEDTGFKEETETKDSLEPITYDEFFESSTNKQIVDDYVNDYFDRAKRQGEQANISADQIVEEFKKDWNGFYSEETLPLIKERIQDKIGYPKGTSKEYTDEVNESYNKALPVLEKAGIKLEEFKGETNKQGGFDTNAKEIMDKYVFNPFREKYPSGNNDAWNKEYKPLYDAIESVLDKQYNDWYIKKAPYGF